MTQKKSEEPIPLKSIAADKSGALHPDDTVKTAGDRMREHDACNWPVTEGRNLVGMVDSRNPDWQVTRHGHDPDDCKVGEIMNKDLIFCYEDEDSASARKLMEERGLAFLPVVDRQMRIVGIFSLEEIVEKAGAAESEKD